MPKLFNSVTNKQGLFVFGGEASSDYGIVVAEAPTFEQPTRKQTVYTIPGRNGAIIEQQDAWEDVTRKYKVWLTKTGTEKLNTSVNSLTAWLNSQNGYTRLEDSFEPEVFRLAYYSGGNDVSNELTQYGESTLTFTCRPERFLVEGAMEYDVTNDQKLGNPTRFKSKPLIYIEVAAPNTTVLIGDAVGHYFELTLDDYAYVDCETMNVYRLDYENLNNVFVGNFLELIPGNNNLTIHDASKVTFIPRYFTI